MNDLLSLTLGVMAMASAGAALAQDKPQPVTVDKKDVPVSRFWSISAYNAMGYFEKNELGAYALNNLTATPDAGGSTRVQFGGCERTTRKCLPVMAGRNYTVRLYRPKQVMLDCRRKFPEAKPVASP